MAKKIITLAIIASGFEAFSAAFATDPKQAAQDVWDIIADQKSASETASKTIEEKNLELENVKAELATTKQVNESLTEEVENLSTSTSKTNPLENLSFKIGDKRFGFKFHSMSHKGKQITSEDVVANKELQETLVKIGSGMIKEL